MKNLTRIKRGISYLLCGLLVCSCAFVACAKEPSGNGKNVIYIIGDGMGFNHIENTKLYMGEDKLAFEEYYVGEVTTHSADSDVTDSAASATALATGVKTKNGYVGVDENGNTLENLMEISKKYGKKTGVVTTDTLDGATPSGFSAHVDDRDKIYDINMQQQTGKVDLLMGKYGTAYDIYRPEYEANGFMYADMPASLNELPKGKKCLANIENVSPIHGEYASLSSVPLKTLVEYALDFLSDDKDGFTLMVEGAYIDKHSHSNNIMKMIYALMDLNDAIEYVLDWASERTDTSVIITADHETGALQKAASKEELSGALYMSESHSASNVPLYLYNAKTELTAIDNTDVFQIAKSIVVG